MDILNAYDLTGSYRAAAALCGCSHHTVKKAVDDRAAGLVPAARRARMIDEFLPSLEMWVVDSRGKIRSDKAHEKLVALGFTGTQRTTRRAVAEMKAQWRLGNTRVHRPWVSEPGLWLQYDFGDGPLVDGRKVVWLVAWLAWLAWYGHSPTWKPRVPSSAPRSTRVHRATGRVPAEMLEVQAPGLHQIPELPHTAALGVTRKVPDNTPMVSFDHCQYSVPATLLGQTVWVREHTAAGEIVICALDAGGPAEVARHARTTRTTRGTPAIDDAHFPGHGPKTPGDYRIRARTDADRAFLEIGEGAAMWLKEAAAVGTERMRQKMAHAVQLSVLGTRTDVDWALGHAAVHGRFATGDLDTILASKGTDLTRHNASETSSLAQGTSGWNLLGNNTIDDASTTDHTAADTTATDTSTCDDEETTR